MRSLFDYMPLLIYLVMYACAFLSFSFCCCSFIYLFIYVIFLSLSLLFIVQCPWVSWKAPLFIIIIIIINRNKWLPLL